MMRPNQLLLQRPLWRLLTVVLLVLTICIASSGCQKPKATSANGGSAGRDPDTYPLHFKQHNFEAHCYNTQRCSVIYDQSYHTGKFRDNPAPAPRSDDYRKRWGGATYIGIRNFPAPAKVAWTSLDGHHHHADVDFSKIFKDELILHDTPINEIPERAFKGPAGNPSIFLEVNDRTVSVYMSMFIPTKSEQIPGNRHSHFRQDVFLAWKKKY